MTRTNAAGVLTVIVRATALWLFARSALQLPELIRLVGQPETDAARYALYGIGVLGLLAVFLWLFADIIAKFSLARPAQPLFESDLDFSQWQALAFSVVGLYLAASGLYVLLSSTVLFLLIRAETAVFDSTGRDPMLVASFDAAFELAVGVALLLGARGLVGLVQRLRYAGPGAPVRNEPGADSN